LISQIVIVTEIVMIETKTSWIDRDKTLGYMVHGRGLDLGMDVPPGVLEYSHHCKHLDGEFEILRVALLDLLRDKMPIYFRNSLD
jgi:hypothetical protein